MDHELINIIQEQLEMFPAIQLVGCPVNTPTPTGAALRETCLIRSPLLKGFHFMDMFFIPHAEDMLTVKVNFFTVHSDGKLEIMHSHDLRAAHDHIKAHMHMLLDQLIADFATARNEVCNDKIA